MTRVAKWVRDLVGPPPFKVGDRVRDADGHLVKIVAGQFWGEHGLSNFWSWRRIKPNGKLGKLEHGYGWTPLEPRSKGRRERRMDIKLILENQIMIMQFLYMLSARSGSHMSAEPILDQIEKTKERVESWGTSRN